MLELGEHLIWRGCQIDRSISALQMTRIIFVIFLGQSFELLFIQLDTSLNPSDPLVKCRHQYQSVD
jgi:hypothetical protein